MDERIHGLRIRNAQLMYYMGIHDPDRLSDEEWAARYREMDYLRGVEAKINSKMLSNRL
ncbi:MAG: hypothetical protein LBI45_02115 [Bacteroidales bacterium]|nr:hypothetical protein [Bacteroidales bacterium]